MQSFIPKINLRNQCIQFFFIIRKRKPITVVTTYASVLSANHLRVFESSFFLQGAEDFLLFPATFVLCPLTDKSTSLFLCQHNKQTNRSSSLQNRPRGPRGVVDMQLYSCFNVGNRWGGWSRPHLGRFTSGKNTVYPLYRRLGGSQGLSGRVRRISPPTGIPSPDRPAVTSRYTD